MKVFKVITDHEGEDKKIERMRQYLTQKDNSLEKVAAYYTAYCEQCEYVLDVVQTIE